MAFVSRVLRVRQGEGRITALVVALALVSMAALTIGESGISALFFERVGADSLPFIYLLQGAVTFVVMLALTGALARVEHRRAYLAAPLALAALVVAERAALQTEARWIYAAMWITVAVATLVTGIAVWGTAGAVVDTRQAKRLFPIFAAGGILGAVIGGVVTRPLAAAIGAGNLLVVWVAGLVVVFVLTRMILVPARHGTARRAPVRRLTERPSALRDLGAAFAFVRRSRLLVWMTFAAVLFSVLFYSLYLPYADAAAERFANADDLAGFFGLFWAGVTGVAFLVSMLAANRLFAWLGVAAAVVILPILYGGAFGVLLIASNFTTLVALRFVIGTWLQGVASPAWETLTNVVPEHRRDQTRAFLNGGPTQVGTIIAGIVALVGERALTQRQFAVIGLAAAVATVVATLGIRRSYTGALVDALRAGRPQVFEPVSARGSPLAVGADAARVLEESMRSDDVRERRLAFQLATELPAGVRPDAIATGLADEDPIVRYAAVRAVDTSSDGASERLASLIDDTDATVAASAAARSLTLGDEDRGERRLRRLLADPDEGTRRAATEQLALAPPDPAAELASELLGDPSAEVRAAALDILARAAPTRAADHAVVALGDSNAIVRRAAGRALGAASDHGFDEVLSALNDPRTADGAIEAIRRMENVHEDRTRTFIRRLAAHATADRELAAVIPDADDATRLLRDAIVDRGRRVARSGLWAGTLLARRRGEMEIAIENLDAGAGQLANALETLESAVEPAVVRPFVSLWEPAAGATHGDDWLSRALDDDDAFIRRCAELVRHRREGGSVAGSVETISTIERVLFLRRVPLFADLAPADLERVAQLAEEGGYADGEVIAAEGELGEDLHIVVSGTIRVVRDAGGTERDIARRTEGDVVGEMSIITKTPRIATLVAEGPVRTIRLRHREFESMLRERPGIAMAVMRVLAQRLTERALDPPDS